MKEIENQATGELEELEEKGNNVKYVETKEGKWVWKKYNSKGKVIFMSKVFDTVRETRVDYDNSCPFCNTSLSSKGIICKCEIAPKYDSDYEEWKNK